MMSNLAVDYNDPVSLHKAGIKALSKELGPLGMVLFMRHYDNGYGDHTAEREELLKGFTIEDFERFQEQPSRRKDRRNIEAGAIITPLPPWLSPPPQ